MILKRFRLDHLRRNFRCPAGRQDVFSERLRFKQDSVDRLYLQPLSDRQAYEDRIKQLVTDYKSKGVAVVAISPNDPRAIRLDELGYTDLSDTFEEMKIGRRICRSSILISMMVRLADVVEIWTAGDAACLYFR